MFYIRNLQLHTISQTQLSIAWNIWNVSYRPQNKMTYSCDYNIYLYHKETNKCYLSLNKTKVFHQNDFARFNHTFQSPLPTGVYNISVSNRNSKESMNIVLPAIGALSTGGTCFLINGSLFDKKDMWCVLTNHHALRDPTSASQIKVLFNDVLISNLRPDIFWKTHTNEGTTGLDYSCIAIDDTTKQNLINLQITPNQIGISPKHCYDNLMLVHRPAYANMFLHTLCKITEYKSVKTKYDYLGITSGGGSSGSPIFGIDKTTKKIGVCGLHKAKGTCVNIDNVINDLKN